MEDVPRSLSRANDGLAAAGSLLASAAVLVTALAVSADALYRAISGSSIGGIVEVSTILLVVIAFLPLAQAEVEGQHVAVSLVTDRLPARRAGLVRLIGSVVGTVFVVLLAWSSADRAWRSVATGEARFGLVAVPVWPSRVAIAVGVVLFGLQYVRRLWAKPVEGDIRQRSETVDSPEIPMHGV